MANRKGKKKKRATAKKAAGKSFTNKEMEKFAMASRAKEMAERLSLVDGIRHLAAASIGFLRVQQTGKAEECLKKSLHLCKELDDKCKWETGTAQMSLAT